MKIEIESLNLNLNKTNEVTSDKLFADRKKVDVNNKIKFHPDGIFSKRIFGQWGKCDCKDEPRTKPGLCPKCKTRVLNNRKLPNFYIKFDQVRIPKLYIDFTNYSKIKDKLNKLLNYEAFIYDGNFYDISESIENINLEEIDEKKILIGKDAVLTLGVDEKWYNEHVTNILFIPHPTFRPIVNSGDKYYLGKLNSCLITILKRKKDLSKLHIQSKDKLSILLSNQLLISDIKEYYKEIYFLLAKKNNSIVDSEIIGQSITSAIRAVVTNNFSLDEDTIIIGKYFIKTLYPELMLKHCEKEFVGRKQDGSNEQIWEYNLDKVNIKTLNEELLEKSYKVLVNRQPTIGEKSIISMIPQFSDKEEEKFVVQVNPIIQDGLAGDFDGDAFLIIALYTTEANKEAELLLPSKNYIGGANNQIRNSLPEDFVYVMQKTYEDKNSSYIDEIENIIYGGKQ